MLKKIISIFMLLSLVARTSIAENIENKSEPQEEIFKYIVKGEDAPFTGFIFTRVAIAKIYSEAESKEKSLKLSCQKETDLLKLDLKKNAEKNALEKQNREVLLANITNEKNEKIEQLTRKVGMQNYAIVGAFVTGIVMFIFIDKLTEKPISLEGLMK